MATAPESRYLTITPLDSGSALSPRRLPMITLFWFALVLGGGLALFSLVGDFFDGDAGEGTTDHLHIEHEGADSSWQLFSLRTLTYFLFAFGAVGVLLHYTSG